MLKTTSFTVKPLSEALGAEIIGLDLRQNPSPQTVEDIIAAWHEHLVLLFRDRSRRTIRFVSRGTSALCSSARGRRRRATRPPCSNTPSSPCWFQISARTAS